MLHGEVHHRSQASCIAVPVPCSLLPICNDQRIQAPLLSNDIELRIFLHDAAAPIAQELLIGIAISVLPDPAQTECLYPPNGILDEVVRNKLVHGIHIGHMPIKPTTRHQIFIRLGSICVLVHGSPMIRSQTSIRIVEPIFVRQVFHPPVTCTNMIHHTIVNQFDPLLPRLGGKLFVLFHRSISWIHFVVIGDGIAMI